MTKKLLAMLSVAALVLGVSGAAVATADVEICHNGKTITVDESAVQKHLKHGDTLGACPEISDPEPSDEPTSEPTEEPTVEPTVEPTPSDKDDDQGDGPTGNDQANERINSASFSNGVGVGGASGL